MKSLSLLIETSGKSAISNNKQQQSDELRKLPFLSACSRCERFRLVGLRLQGSLAAGDVLVLDISASALRLAPLKWRNQRIGATSQHLTA